MKYHLEDIDVKVATLRKLIEHRFHDSQSVLDEKMKIYDKKILEVFTDRTYQKQIHEQNIDIGDHFNFKEISLILRIEKIENKLEKVDLLKNNIYSQNSDKDLMSFRKKNNKIDYLEEKMIENADHINKTEKLCLDLNQNFEKKLEQLKSVTSENS